MKFLRRISTRRLIVLCSVTLAAVIGVAAVAMATSGNGPKPQPKPLAGAIHDALDAPTLPGITARVDFTNNLIDASSLEGTDPLLSGATGRLWASPDDGGQVRLELQSDVGNDTQVLVSGRHFQVYDGTAETVYEGTLPAEKEGKEDAKATIPGIGEIEKAIAEVAQSADLSGAVPTNVAGEPAYSVRIGPKHDGGLIGAAELAWDAENGVPLRAAIYSSSGSSPVIELEATEVSFEAVPSSTFEVAPPASAKVVNLSPGTERGTDKDRSKPVSGIAAVQQSVDFELDAPAALVGLPRAAVKGIEVDGRHAALATYGKGLGGIAVIESKSEAGAPAPGDDPSTDLSLPKVSINGIEGEELDTALGTVLRFSRGGIDYIVAGSVPPAAAEAAARAL